MNLCKFCNILFTPHKLHPNAATCSSKSCRQKYKNLWAIQNPESKQKWTRENRVKVLESSDKYRRKNSAYYNQYASCRKRTKNKASIPISEFNELWLIELYNKAKVLKLEVDHIIPLKHDKVCGLHVPWNMQLLTKQQNRQKSNKFLDEDIVARIKDDTSDNVEA